MKLTKESEGYINNALVNLIQANYQLNKVQHEDSYIIELQNEIADVMNKLRAIYLEED
ncbi:hypothetical protein [Enterococcus phage vB_OCPT_SDS2]|nr:hypothetical protein [Enterococcus phage vB_OCPT_SDS2]